MVRPSQNILIVTGDTGRGNGLRDMVQAGGRRGCVVLSSLESIEGLADEESIAAILLDRSLQIGDPDKYRGLFARYPVATFGRAADDTAGLEAIESLARFRLRHPVEMPDIERLFDDLGRTHSAGQPAETARPSHLFRGLVGDSEPVRELRSVIDRVSPTLANVLVLGETGTGKEVVARNIHYRSANAGGPFVAVNCSAIPADLLESELFGHKKGAFTGAVNDRVGRFELASGGTLFLDEIGDMPLVLQVKLLRVLEERMIYRLGGDKGVPMTARLVAATHRDLDKLVASGAFREDLSYRLNVIPITVPPLRDRKVDIPDLIRELCARIRHEQQVAIEFTAAATESLQRYDWPGNVRELANLMERLTVLHPNGCIGVDDLPSEIRGTVARSSGPENTAIAPEPELAAGFDLKEHLRLTETQLIRQALDSSGGVVTRAAELLQVRRTTLTEKVKRLGLGDLIKSHSQPD